MNELKGMRSIVGVLVAQVFLLSIVLILGLFIFWVANFESSQSRFITASCIFLVAFCSSIFLLAVWNLLINFLEEWWSIIAVQRVRKWLLLPLYFASVTAFAASTIIALVAILNNSDSLVIFYTRLLPSILLVLTTGIPLATSSLLMLGGIKRTIVLKKNMQLFQASVAEVEDSGMSRIRASVNAENGISDTFASPKPKGFFFAGLTSKPWYESKEFDWIAEFQNAYVDILAEATTVMSALGDNIEHYDYQGLNTDKWKKVSLIANRIENNENLAACPVTASLLKKIPGYPTFRDAMFSILEPNGIIPPHRDYGNLFLTMHFGLIVPPNGYMEVANMRREWQAGKALVFDSSYNHQAVNQSDKARVILLVDFLNPDLSETERKWVLTAPFWKTI